MKHPLALILAVACAAALQTSVTPAAAQESPQTVKAAIPPQGRPATAPPATARPEIAQARPEMARQARPAPGLIPPIFSIDRL